MRSLQSLPALEAEGFGDLLNLPFLEDGMKKVHVECVLKREGVYQNSRDDQSDNLA